ncbi:hypothetical protein AB6A40_010048 [Gnathostoma spinigerum]|uniref:Uncharacterized protein n=1 Tax=Gnathostoma spinigerum TaxID=75299 RepID=A0ABD6ETN8_9BILA
MGTMEKIASYVDTICNDYRTESDIRDWEEFLTRDHCRDTKLRKTNRRREAKRTKADVMPDYARFSEANTKGPSDFLFGIIFNGLGS